MTRVLNIAGPMHRQRHKWNRLNDSKKFYIEDKDMKIVLGLNGTNTCNPSNSYLKKDRSVIYNNNNNHNIKVYAENLEHL